MYKLRVLLSLSSILCFFSMITVGLFLTEEWIRREEQTLRRNQTENFQNQIMFQNIPECSCERLLFYPPPYDNQQPVTIYNSSCSDPGTFYQKGQRVVTFSMYYGRSDKRRQALYKDGIQLNLQRMREFYPGHSMRLYTDVNLDSKSDYCPLLCNNSDIFWCDIRNTPSLGDMTEMFGPNWRFLTLGDPTVEYFLSRDLDSVITEREAGAVHDWLQTGKSIHLMRDKQKAHNVQILAGMWGARNNLLGSDEDVVKLRDEIINQAKSNRRYKGQDQSILGKLIYKPRKHDIVAYDSYHCKYYKRTTKVRPFPIKRKNGSDFVGNYNLGRKEYEMTKCPKECRPSYGKDWEYC